MPIDNSRRFWRVGGDWCLNRRERILESHTVCVSRMERPTRTRSRYWSFFSFSETKQVGVLPRTRREMLRRKLGVFFKKSVKKKKECARSNRGE